MMAGRAGVMIAAMMLIGAVPLGSCSQSPPPPPLTERDLRDVVAIDNLGRIPPSGDVVRALAAMPGFCIDLHRAGESGFRERAHDLNSLDKASMRLGLRGGLTGWREPGPTGTRTVDKGTADRLARVTARLMLRLSGEKLPVDADKPWLESCRQRYWLATPVYEDAFAFIERGSVCGGLCGSGELIALEYRDRRWRVVGVQPTWIS